MSRLTTASFFLLCAVLGLRLSFLHDEGVFSFDLAAALPRAFLPFLFYVKVKPPIVLLYALPAQLGLKAFLVAHAALAAAAIPLTVAAARRLGLANPNLAGFALATSLGFTVAASGFANSDGAFFLALFLWLWAGEKRLWAGLVLGLLPLVRFELGLCAVVFLAFDSRLILPALLLPLVYLLSGAAYHRDWLWPIHTLPNVIQPADVRRYQAPGAVDFLRYLSLALLQVFSLLGVLGLAAWDRRNRRLRPVFVAAAGTFVALVVLAGLDRWFAVDRSLRYHVAALPLAAVLAASVPGRSGWLVWVQALFLAAALLFTDAGREQRIFSQRLLEAVRQSRLYHGQPIYTDVQIMRYQADAWMLANDSILYEIEHAVGEPQKAALSKALAGQRFLLTRDPPRHDAVYVIDPGRDRLWREHLEADHPAFEDLGSFRLYAWP